MLCKMTFCLSSKVAAIHVDNGTAKAYLCNQGGTACLCLSRLAHCILHLANKYGSIFILAYIPTCLSVEAAIFSWGLGWFPSGTSFLT